ncbi:unnamed protein product [Paramecium sonneborni]|nr:unnamed protein product [Paramecium sonneborni]
MKIQGENRQNRAVIISIVQIGCIIVCGILLSSSCSTLFTFIEQQIYESVIVRSTQTILKNANSESFAIKARNWLEISTNCIRISFKGFSQNHYEILQCQVYKKEGMVNQFFKGDLPDIEFYYEGIEVNGNQKFGAEVSEFCLQIMEGSDKVLEQYQNNMNNSIIKDQIFNMMKNLRRQLRLRKRFNRHRINQQDDFKTRFKQLTTQMKLFYKSRIIQIKKVR